MIAVPGAAFEQGVDDALAAGARGIVAITAGLGEIDEGGKELERRVVEKVRSGRRGDVGRTASASRRGRLARSRHERVRAGRARDRLPER